jgi:thiol-disulfide isomerase/thioredoxin/DNA-binding beta-propeller fold protein YncE
VDGIDGNVENSMQKSLIVTGAALGFLVLSVIALIVVQKGAIMAQQSRSQVHAPEFPPDLQWLNTDTPLTIAGLRGKVVLLDFWTYCCINCMHVIPDLKALEEKYPNELVVIGVHSAKFSNEREADNIRQAILRYEIEHPVVNDHEFRIWQSYGVRSWPTLALIDPGGYVIGGVSGEGNFELLDHVIGEVVQAARAKGALDETRPAWALEKTKSPPSTLAFPGKILADEASERLFIADSNHHRIVIADLQGKVLDVAGTGQGGRDDGTFAQAAFNHPQGLALDGRYLYVADTENHLIRRLDLQQHQVETLLGTGQQARQFNIPGVGRAVAINSPWDLAVVERRLYIAMAGAHQVWVLNLDTLEAQPFAGSGREDITDGQRLEAAMAQPSGLATDGKTLYVADSETSSIRAIDLGVTGNLRTLVGEGLFEFGDQDGTGPQVRLQHPLGVALHQDRLYVADTYNHKIKVLYPSLKTSQTYLGSGRPGYTDGRMAEFYEPAGLSIARGKLYIADTNNHAIRVADLSSGEVGSLRLTALAIPDAVAAFEGTAWMDGEAVTMPLQTIKAGADGELVINFELPAGYKLNPAAPVHYALYIRGEGLRVPHSGCPLSAHAVELPLKLPFQTLPGKHRAELDVEATFYWCRQDNSGICMIQSTRWHVPVETSETDGHRQLTVSTTAQLLDQSGPPLFPAAPLEYKKDGSR